MALDLRGAVWRKSSRSGASGGQCVEVAVLSSVTAVRDSKNADGAVLTFRVTAFDTFLTAAKAGEFGR